MKVIYVYFVTLCICLNSKQIALEVIKKRPSHATVTNIESLNELCDVIMREVELIMPKYKLDPFNAPNQRHTLAMASLTLTNLQIFNLATITRADNIVIVDDPHKRTMSVRMKFKLDDLGLSTDYKLAGMVMSTGGSLEATMPGLSLEFVIVFDYKKLSFRMTEFEATKSDDPIDVTFKKSISSFFMNMMTPIFTGLFANMFINVANGPIKYLMNGMFEQLNEEIQNVLMQMSKLGEIEDSKDWLEILANFQRKLFQLE